MTQPIHELKSISRKKHRKYVKTGLSRTVAYSRWRGMMNRCYRKKDICYKNYGGRGIKVCDEWHDVKMFAKWFEQNYHQGTTLNRIDNNGSYSPANCNFVSSKEQSANKSTTKYSQQIADSIRELNKTIKSQRQIAFITGIHYKYVNLILKNKRWPKTLE